MSDFMIIENDEGLCVVELAAGKTAEQTALERGGEIIDAGPYHAYDDAYDAMQQIPAVDDGDDL